VSNTSAIFDAIFGAEHLLHEPNKWFEVVYMPYLIDSDVLIDISRGKPAAREYVDALPEG